MCVSFGYTLDIRTNYCTQALLKPLDSPDDSPKSYVCVLNTHLYWNPQCEEVKLAQLHYLLHFCDLFLRKNKIKQYNQEFDCPKILCGDFNSLPKSKVYDFATTKTSDISYVYHTSHIAKVNNSRAHKAHKKRVKAIACLERIIKRTKKIQSKVQEGKTDYNIQSYLKLLKTIYALRNKKRTPLNINFAKILVRASKLLSKKKKIDQNHQNKMPFIRESTIPLPTHSMDETGCQMHCTHSIALSSVYSQYLRLLNQPSNRPKYNIAKPHEPVYTNFTEKFNGTLDYIFFDQNKRSKKLNHVRMSCDYLLRLHSAQQCEEEGWLPSTKQPSDHIPIGAVFQLHHSQKE